MTLDAIALINARHANRYLILESLTWDHDSLGITINERQVSKGDDEVKKGMTLVSRKDIKKRRSTLHPDVLASGLEIGRCTIDYSFRSLILADDHHRHHLGDHHEKIRKKKIRQLITFFFTSMVETCKKVLSRKESTGRGEEILKTDTDTPGGAQ